MADATDSDRCWGAPTVRVLHPLRVAIVECMRQAGRPVSARELAGLLGGREMRARVDRHLQRLASLGIVIPADRSAGIRSRRQPTYLLAVTPD